MLNIALPNDMICASMGMMMILDWSLRLPKLTLYSKRNRYEGFIYYLFVANTSRFLPYLMVLQFNQLKVISFLLPHLLFFLVIEITRGYGF